MSNTRALEIIENSAHPWESFNTIFGDHTSILDDLFNRGVRTNLEGYVKTNSNFEIQFCKIQLDPVRASNTHRIHVLQGKIGRGKSTFVDYCRKVVMPDLYGDELLILFVDLQTFDIDNTDIKLRNKIIECIEEILLIRFFNSDLYKLQRVFIEHFGYPNISPIDTINIYTNIKTVDTLIKFINDFISHETFKISGILLILDNVDENPKEVIKICDILIKDLIKICENKLKLVPFTVLVPVRDYNANSFSHTQKVNNTNLRNVEANKIIFNKIILLKNQIVLNTRLDYQDIIDYHVRVDGISRIQQKVIVISKDDLVNYLDSFADSLFKSNDGDVYEILHQLSAGNLKILIANVFNILHSNKLPLSLLFRKYFIDRDLHTINEIDEPFTVENVIECLLSIHFPYFTHLESHIINLFNCNNSSNPKEFRDQLVLVKIICAANNIGSFTVNNIKGIFEQYSYSLKLVERGLKLCFENGILETDIGIRLSHLDNEHTQIRLSSLGNVYLYYLLTNITYFQYVCEDTYLPDDYVIPILTKYSNGNFHGSRENRILSGIKLCEYLINVLEKERQIIENNLNKSYDSFLEIFGYPASSKNYPFQDKLRIIINSANRKLYSNA